MSGITGQIGDSNLTAGLRDDSLSNTLSSMLLDNSSSSKGNEAKPLKDTFNSEDIHRFYNPSMGQNVSRTI